MEAARIDDARFHDAELRQEPRTVRYLRVQAAISRAIAMMLFIAALPVIGVAVLVVKLTSPGPGIYRQVRMGRGGRPFTMYKIRTMRRDAEVQTGPVWSAPHDTRVTPVGRYLRRTHIDELPQLLNVVLGQMSLVGPRPERPEIASRLVEHLPAYPQRLAVPPGVTGLAQVELPPDHELEDVRRKLAVDLEYLHRADWRLDLWILYRTGLHLFGLGRPLAVAVEPEVLDAARGGGSDAGRRTIRIDEPQPRRAAGSGPKRRQPQEATASASRKAA